MVNASTMSQPMEEQTSQKVFGGCEGPDAMYVKLISSDGHEFIGMYLGPTPLSYSFFFLLSFDA